MDRHSVLAFSFGIQFWHSVLAFSLDIQFTGTLVLTLALNSQRPAALLMRLELQIKTSDCSRNLPAIGAYQSGCSIYISNASQLLENEVVQFYWPFVGRFSTCSHQFIRLFTSPPTRVFSHLTLSTAIKLLCASSIRQLLSLKDLFDALSMLFSFDLHLPVAFSVSLLYFEFLLRFSASFSAQFSISLSPSRILILWPFIADKLSKLMPNWQTSLMALVKLIHRFRSLLLGIDLNIGRIMRGTRDFWNGTPEHSEAIPLNSLSATEIGCYRAISRDKVECSSVSTSSSADWLPREGVTIEHSESSPSWWFVGITIQLDTNVHRVAIVMASRTCQVDH